MRKNEYQTEGSRGRQRGPARQDGFSSSAMRPFLNSLVRVCESWRRHRGLKDPLPRTRHSPARLGNATGSSGVERLRRRLPHFAFHRARLNSAKDAGAPRRARKPARRNDVQFHSVFIQPEAGGANRIPLRAPLAKFECASGLPAEALFRRTARRVEKLGKLVFVLLGRLFLTNVLLDRVVEKHLDRQFFKNGSKGL